MTADDKPKTTAADLRPTGTVTVGPLTFVVGAMDQTSEYRLSRLLAAKAKAAKGTYLSILRKTIDEARDDEKSYFLRLAGTLEATGEPLSAAAVEEFATSPAGAAFELWYRASKHTPELKFEEVAAVVNEANSVEVYLQTLAACTPKSGDTPAGKPLP